MESKGPFGAISKLKTGSGNITYYALSALEKEGELSRLPFSLRVLLEALLRKCDGKIVTRDDVLALVRWRGKERNRREVPFMPARVILQDFTGVPAVVDLAAMRSALARLGGDPKRINPLIPVDLVIDHSVQVDRFGTTGAFKFNAEMELTRNRERYAFLHWGEKTFDNFRIVPPSTGIVHQVNLEYLAPLVTRRDEGGEAVAYPDTLIGTDSHTTMINGLGVLGWGVGGIEAEAVMLGQPYNLIIPDVVGVRLTGELREGVTATDLVLSVTELLRKQGVVGKFVEFFGAGLSHLPLADRATIANMAPEYGATMGYFPVDSETLDYLTMTGREKEHVDFVECYMKEQGLFRTDETPDPEYTTVIDFDLVSVESSLAGPKRPQDRVKLGNMAETFREDLTTGFGILQKRTVDVVIKGVSTPLSDGSVVIAAITSCTNTSNPTVMIGAGLMAKRAVEKGLKVKPYVKTSLAPGSRAVTEYLKKAGLLAPLEKIGFNVVGYGCTTCIGNSGPLPDEVAKVVNEKDLVVASVLSGNRNFEGRINPLVKANYLASPMLVVAFALAGRADIDLFSKPLGKDYAGNDVFLKDLWPDNKEIARTIGETITPDVFKSQYAHVFDGNSDWNRIEVDESELYRFDDASTYIREPDFFEKMTVDIPEPMPIEGARVLALLGDSVTTDHISPAGAIPTESPAGRYLQAKRIVPVDFNSYGSRRGNHEVMIRGTFGNIRLKNLLLDGKEGGYTRYLLDGPYGEETTIFEAAERYREDGVPLIVIAGKEYGTGSSRDWAAKGTFLLGVRAVIAESYERIHRSNLVGMGVLPLQFKAGESRQTLGLTGREVYTIEVPKEITPGASVKVRAVSEEGESPFEVLVRLDSQTDIEVYRHGGILQRVLREML